MRAAPLALGLIGALAAAGCADQAATPPPATGQQASVMVCAPGSFRDGNECIPAKTDCPSGTVLQDGSCVAVPPAEDPPPPPEEAPDAQIAQVAQGAQAVSGPTFEAVVDPRPGRAQPRARALLITEIQALERLFQATPKSAPDRPKLMRRLADGYVELSAAAARDGQAAAPGTDAVKMQKVEQAARVVAIKYYHTLVQEYPKYCTGGTTGCADEALYYVSLEYIRASQQNNARSSLLELIRNFPRSSLLPHAYFQFGEMFFAESTQDPSKWPLAEQSYLEASKSSASPIAPYALLRLAEVYAKQGNAAKAQSVLARIARDYPGSGAAQQAPAGP